MTSRHVTRVAWEELREPFRKVWSGEEDSIWISLRGSDTKIRIYRMSRAGVKLVVVEIPDYDQGPLQGG
jgi:hypothetical protein